MAVRPLVDFREKTLREPSRPVDPFDREVREAIRDLWDTLGTKRGLAMAAPQIGLSFRLFVYDLKRSSVKGNQAPVRGVLINPEIMHREGTITVVEGCLSFPDLDLSIVRPERVTVSGLNEAGERVVYSGEGLFARMIEHEMDHLDGVLLLDRQTSWGRLVSLWRRWTWERSMRKRNS